MNQNQIQIQTTPEQARGNYSNVMQVQHTKEEFVMDFLTIFPPMGALGARIIMSPGHLKRVIRALEENVKKYEATHGNIEEAKSPDEPKMGFTIS